MKTIFMFILILIVALLFAHENKFLSEKMSKTEISEKNFSIINVSNFSSYIINNGIGSNNPYNSNHGAFYPKGTANVVYSDGLVWGGYVIGDPDGTKPSLRVGGQIYYSSTLPGYVKDGVPISPEDSEARVYRIRKNWETLTEEQLRQDAATTFNVDPDSVDSLMTAEILNRYTHDWQYWPVKNGAPFIDKNDNGKWEGPEIDEPGLPEVDQIIYFVMNDFDQTTATKFLGSPPLGLEIQTLIYAFDNTDAIYGQYYFKHYRIINKSDYTIDSLYIGHFADTDVGDYKDDFCGYNSEHGIAYAYNAQSNDTKFDNFGLIPSAVGYKLLLGPTVPSEGDTAVSNFQLMHGHKNLGIKAFNYQATGSSRSFPFPGMSDYNGTLKWYNILRGYMPTADVDNPTPQEYGSGPNQGNPTKLPLDGNPILNSGDVDGTGNNMNQGDRSIVLACGPCTLEPGQSQEFNIAVVGGNLGSNRNSIIDMINNGSDLKSGALDVAFDTTDISSKIIRNISSAIPSGSKLDQNYPNPFNPTTHINFDVNESSHVTLTIFDIRGRSLKTLIDKNLPSGEYSVEFNAQDLASGIYFYHIKMGAFTATRKMILNR